MKNVNKQIRDNATNLSRRQFIISSAAVSGGLALGFHLPFGEGSHRWAVLREEALVH